jgi:hypothetical protein
MQEVRPLTKRTVLSHPSLKKSEGWDTRYFFAEAGGTGDSPCSSAALRDSSRARAEYSCAWRESSWMRIGPVEFATRTGTDSVQRAAQPSPEFASNAARLAARNGKIGGMTTPLKTLFLNPPSFEKFDGGASSRWPATREIESYWYPVWLTYPAGMLEGSRLVDASPHHLKVDAETIEIGKEYEFLVLFTSTMDFRATSSWRPSMKANQSQAEDCVCRATT